MFVDPFVEWSQKFINNTVWLVHYSIEEWKYEIIYNISLHISNVEGL